MNKKENLKGHHLLIICIFLTTVCLCVFYYHSLKSNHIEKHHILHKRLVEVINLAFEQYLHPLQGITSSIHYADFKISSTQFRKASEARNMYSNFKGALGFGFIRYVKKSELKNYLNSQKIERPDFDLRRPFKSEIVGDKNKDLFVIEFVEPFEKNIKAVGLVVSDEKYRKEAALIAMKSGKPSITKSIQLVQSTHTEPGFLLYYPIYKHTNALSMDKEKIQNFIGWAYAPLTLSEIIKFVKLHLPKSVSFKISEQATDKKMQDIYNDTKYEDVTTDRPLFSTELIFYGQKWVLSSFSNQLDEQERFIKTALLFLLMNIVTIIFYIYFKKIELDKEYARRILEESKIKVDEATKILNEKQALLYSKSKLSSLGEMAGGIAHEINNPLAIIKGKSQVANILVNQITNQDELKNKLIDTLKSVDLTVDRVAKIVKGLRAFSRDSDGDPFVKINVSNLLADALALCEERLKQLNIKVNTEIFNNDCYINCNEIQLQQVLMNLILNSVDAISQLDEKWINVSVQEISNMIKIRIVDSGVGISPDILTKIMEPFFTTKEVGRGTGLGLSISKGIIEIHKGTIHYELYNGHTSFVLTLPGDVKSHRQSA